MTDINKNTTSGFEGDYIPENYEIDTQSNLGNSCGDSTSSVVSELGGIRLEVGYYPVLVDSNFQSSTTAEEILGVRIVNIKGWESEKFCTCSSVSAEQKLLSKGLFWEISGVPSGVLAINTTQHFKNKKEAVHFLKKELIKKIKDCYVEIIDEKINSKTKR